MDITITSVMMDLGMTSNVGIYNDPTNLDKGAHGFNMMGNKSSKVFTVGTGEQTAAKETITTSLNLQKPANTYDIMPNIVLDPLTSTNKLTDTGYATIFGNNKIKVYNIEKTEIVVNRKAILKG